MNGTDMIPGVQHRDSRQGGRRYPQQYDVHDHRINMLTCTVDQAVEYILRQPDGMGPAWNSCC